MYLDPLIKTPFLVLAVIPETIATGVDKRNAQGEPRIVHNINSGAKEEDVLRSYEIVDHFRVVKGKR